jgi:hypothetical protein
MARSLALFPRGAGDSGGPGAGGVRLARQPARLGEPNLHRDLDARRTLRSGDGLVEAIEPRLAVAASRRAATVNRPTGAPNAALTRAPELLPTAGPSHGCAGSKTPPAAPPARTHLRSRPNSLCRWMMSASLAEPRDALLRRLRGRPTAGGSHRCGLDPSRCRDDAGPGSPRRLVLPTQASTHLGMLAVPDVNASNGPYWTSPYQSASCSPRGLRPACPWGPQLLGPRSRRRWTRT